MLIAECQSKLRSTFLNLQSSISNLHSLSVLTFLYMFIFVKTGFFLAFARAILILDYDSLRAKRTGNGFAVGEAF